VNGELIRGLTNGDDAVYASGNFIAANDGVGAWSTRPGGHAGYVIISTGNQRDAAKST
jgi:protein phosphatase PTC7